MGVNINSSLFMRGANERFKFSLLEAAYEESYYVPALNVISNIKEELSMANLEFFKLSEEEFLTEGATIQMVARKISEILDAIVKNIKKVKDTIVSIVTKFLNNAKARKIDPSMLKQARSVIEKHYDQQCFFEMAIFDNNLKKSLLDPNIPSVESMMNNREFDNVLNFFNTIRNIELDSYDLEKAVKNSKDNVTKQRMDLRKELTGDIINMSVDLFDFVKFRQALVEYYVGTDENKIINRPMVLQAIDNLSKGYQNSISDISKSRDHVNKKYNELSKRIENLKAQTNDWLLNPMKNVGNGTYDNIETYEAHVSTIAKSVIDVSTMMQGFLSDHLAAFSTKVECLNNMWNQDIRILNGAQAALKSKGLSEANITIYLNQDEYSNQDFLREYAEDMFLLKEEMIDYKLSSYVSKVILEADGDKKENFIVRLINRIVEMFKKFRQNTDVIVQKDKKWLQSIEKTITSPNFQFPAQNETVGEWNKYYLDRISKPIEIPVFDTNNKQLMDALESDETYSAFLLSKLGSGGSITSGSNDDNFAAKCKAVYVDGQPIDVKVSDAQKDKDKFFQYCKDFLEGENGGIYKSIIKDTNSLDNSKKAVMRSLQNQNTTNTQSTTQNTQSNSTTTGTPGATQNASGDNSAKTESSLFGFGAELAKTLGIQEGYSILNEIQTPDVDKTDKDAIKNNISDAVKGSEDNLNKMNEKATRFFTMTGNALGAKMTISIQAYKQYASLFKWALRATDGRGNENSDTLAQNKTTTADTEQSIADQAKK